jgi:hypothetical protein
MIIKFESDDKSHIYRDKIFQQLKEIGPISIPDPAILYVKSLLNEEMEKKNAPKA